MFHYFPYQPVVNAHFFLILLKLTKDINSVVHFAFPLVYYRILMNFHNFETSSTFSKVKFQSKLLNNDLRDRKQILMSQVVNHTPLRHFLISCQCKLYSPIFELFLLKFWI